MTRTPRLAPRRSASLLLHALRESRRGGAITEFALCGAMFIALLLAATQVALIYFVQQGMQTAAEATARKIMTGEAFAARMSQSQFKTMACANLPTYLSCSKLLVDVRRADTFDTLDTNAIRLTYDSNGAVTNTFRYDIGSGESVIILRMMYSWNVVPAPLDMDFSDQRRGVRLITGTMVFRSEPFAA
jgi:Flp pilus assembly protein TadG